MDNHPVHYNPASLVVVRKSCMELCGVYSDVHKRRAKQNLVTFFCKLMCVCSIALGGQWEGVEARGGDRLSLGIFPDPPHALLPTHISFFFKSLDFVWPVTNGHHCRR